MSEKKNISFNFGENWQNFSSGSLDDAKFAEAVKSLSTLIGKDSLINKTFLDIGCGSGIFSIAASHLGVRKVVGIDISKESIDTSKANKNKFASQNNIEFIHKSIFDEDVAGLGKFDIVYSWGVLHHTGKMWEAIDNASKLVDDKSILTIAIYNKHWSSGAWGQIKRIYNWMPMFGKKIMIWLFYLVIALAKFIKSGKNPFKKRRGMNFYYDVVDWIGGYPYEYATKDEIIKYLEARGFRCIKSTQPPMPTGCNEFVFVKL